MTFEECADRAGRIDVSCFCDARKELRAMDAGIRPLAPGLKLVGRARPVACRDDFLPVLMALRAAEPGDVLVVSAPDGHAVAGELFATEGQRKGLAGLIVDGAVRDVATLRASGWPVYSRRITPRAGGSRDLSDAPEAVTCGGVLVHRGDIVVGDDDGVIVAAEDEMLEILPVAEAIHRAEADMLRRMAAGGSLFDGLNLDEHLDALRRGNESRLRLRS